MPPSAGAHARVAHALHRRALLAVLAAAVLLAVCVPVAVRAVADERADVDARHAAAALDASQRGLRITTSSADNPAAQQAAATAALNAAMGDVDVVAARLTYPVEAQGSGGAVVLEHVADWAGRVDIVDGRAPEGGGDAVEVVAPPAAGLATGQRLLVGSAGVPVVVVGLWTPRDPADPLWFADPGLASGTMSDRLTPVGPLFTADDAGVDRVAATPLVRWTVAPAVDGLTTDGLTRLAHGMDGAKAALTAAGVIVQGATVEGQGGHSLAAAAATSLEARDRTQAALVVGLGVAVIALLAAAAAFEVGTRGERETLLARGGRRTWLPRREAPAVLLAAVAAGAAGWAVGALVGSGTARFAVAAAGIGAVATLVVTLRRLPVDARPARVPAAVLLAVLVVATGLAVWRLMRSPDQPDTAARTAPLLLLVCAGLVAWLVVRRPWLPGLAAALTGGAAAYAAQADTAAVRAAWAVAAAGALVVGAAATAATAIARRHRGVPAGATARIPAPARVSAARYAASAVVAGALGVGVALATASAVLGVTS